MANYIPRIIASSWLPPESRLSWFLACRAQLTVADILIARTIITMKRMEQIDPAIVEAHPGLVALCKTVSEEPKIAAYIAKQAAK